MSKLTLEECLAQNGFLTYRIRGVSMQPMLRQGRDLFTVVPKGPERCKKYDVVLYRRPSDPYVLHRIIEVRPDSYVILGDNCIAKEYGIRDEDILGVLTSFQHNGHTVSVSDWRYRLYSRGWVFFQPVRIDDTKSLAFLLRNNANTEETRNLLNEHGYTELILYDASLQAGMQENGKPYICYGFFKQPVYYADYISQVVTAHTMMLASFSFSTIQSGTLQISDVERFMTLADDRKAANELRYVDLNSAFQAVADQNTTQQERQESYEKYEAEQEKRIQELEEKISAIYSRWDEY